MKTICFISSLHPPRDKRIFEKEAIDLAKAGYRVIHLAPGEEPDHIEKGVMLSFYPPVSGLFNRLVNIAYLIKKARRIGADYYHCNEVDSWIIGLILKIFIRTKILFDVHEYYPGDFSENYFPMKLRPLAAFSIRLLFRLLTPITDHLIFAKRTVAADFPGSTRKSSYVFNYSKLEYRNQTYEHVPDEIKKLFAGKFTAVHFGLFNRKRGWPQMLDAMRHLNIPNFQMVVIGTFDDGSREVFDKQAQTYGLQNIIVKDWMPFDKAYQYLLCSQVGLILFQPGIMSHTYAFPHKLFDYMLAGLPVIYPKFALELAPVILKENCGLLVETSKPDEIKTALEKLYRNKAQCAKYGKNGKKAVIRSYNWDRESEKLLRTYRQMDRLQS